ncbi:MAG: amidohydrolase family protein [Ardenticatenaceae bacterium]|nr:amidohydrolase family protein [Ardenticatenaceae bacterium]
MRKALVGGMILDATGAPPVSRGTLVINGDKIEAVGQKDDVPIPPDSEIIDAHGLTLMPGLINTHDHLAHPDPTDPLTDYQTEYARLEEDPDRDLFPYAIRYGRQELLDGVTTVRVVGQRGGVDFRYKRAFDSNLAPGPRIIPSGAAINSTHGTAERLGVLADGVDAVRKAVRQNLRDGAQVIKIFLTGAYRSGVAYHLTTPMFSREEITVAVEEAHRFGVKVIAHAFGGPSVRWAVEAGIDSIEHADLITDDDLDLIVSRGTYIGLTLLWFFTDLYRKRTPEKAEAAVQTVRRFHEAGAKLVLGGDCIHGDHAMVRHLEILTQCGISPMNAVLIGTKRGAEACGIAERRGTLEVGKDADIIGVRGDPLEDISALRNVRLVMKGGEIYSNA